MLRRQIAIYGKGGIGKSTTSSNIAAAIAQTGKKVLLVGCDPKRDTTLCLNNGKYVPSVLDCLRERGDGNIRIEDICLESVGGGAILVESGGPEPGVGCAGRGVIMAFEMLDKLHVFEHFGIDVVIYDVLGDVVCGGFSMPLRLGYAKEVYIVTSGEMMALYAANNLCKAIHRYADSNNIGLGGLILNKRNVQFEDEMVATFAQQIGGCITAQIPRDGQVQQCEARRQTVVLGAPDSPMAQVYRQVAAGIIENESFVSPRPLAQEAFDRFTQSWSSYTP